MAIAVGVYIYVIIASLSLSGVGPDRLAAAIAAEAGQVLQRHEQVVRRQGVAVTASDVDDLAHRAAAAIAQQGQAGDVTVCHRAKPVCLTIER